MIVDTRRIRSIYDKLKSKYPQTLLWCMEKAKREQIPISVVFDSYESNISQLMAQEDGNEEG